MGRNLQAFVLLALSAGTAFGQPERPIRRPVDNKLALENAEAGPARQEIPDAVTGTTSRLVFHTSPLSGKGLLSQQVRDALKALDKANGDAVFIKLRAFVAGTGDVRRIQSIVAEDFADRKIPLPAITSLLVGALPGENTQVIIESISEMKKGEQNPAGLVFIAAQPSIAQLDRAIQTAGATALRVTCFADSLESAEKARAEAAKVFPAAAAAFVQATRSGLGDQVACEGVGRLRARTGAPPIERTDASVLVRLPKLVFTSAQVAFGDSAVNQAEQRLQRTVPGETLFENRYSVVGEGSKIGIVIEGLSAQDATVAVEVIAAAP